MSSPSFAPPLAGNVIGTESDTFVIAEWQDPGGITSAQRPIAPLHLHHHDDEAWYVLEGVLRVRVGEDEVEAQPGACVFVPHGTAHTYWNAGSGKLRYLLIMTANIHRLIQAIHAMPEKSPGALQTMFRKYDSELL